MLKSTHVFRKRANRYPGLVSYNKLPWMMLAPDTPLLHQSACTHYNQMLTLAATAKVPFLVNDFHPEVPEHEWLVTLPNSVYILPGVASAMGNDPKEFGPYNWPYHHITDSVALQYYAPLEQTVKGSISDVICYKSPDLRVICNAVVFRPGAKIKFSENSTFAQISEALEKSGNGDSSSTMPDFVLFHFFRPNRSPGEMSAPLKHFFRHPLSFGERTVGEGAVTTQSAADPVAEIFNLNSKWEPVLEQPQSVKKGKLTPMKAFKPPTSYMPGLYERLAIKPGNAFGRRSAMWGTFF